MNDLIQREQNQLTEAKSESNSVMSILENAIEKGHSVDVVERLLDMQERIMATQARQAYAQALLAVQSEVTPVRKSQYNDHTKSKYGVLEDVWKELKPLIEKYGFSPSFSAPNVGQGGLINWTCTLMHSAGHSKEYTLPLPPDGSGPKGGGNKNPVQAIGSTSTYARRYLLCMIFGVVFENEDDDGVGGNVERISESQAADIESLLQDLPASKKTGLLNWLKIKRIADMPVTRFASAVANLEKMIAEQTK